MYLGVKYTSHIRQCVDTW